MSSSDNNITYKKTSFLAGQIQNLLMNFMQIIFQIQVLYQKVGESFLMD